MPSYGTIPELPHVAKVFCPSECVRLIQDQASMRNVDSRIHSLRFDCCVFLFYSFSAVTFATKSTLVPTANSKRLTATANRSILAADERPLQVDLVRLDRTVPAAGCVGSREPYPSTSTQRVAAQIPKAVGVR